MGKYDFLGMASHVSVGHVLCLTGFATICQDLPFKKGENLCIIGVSKVCVV